MLGVATLIVVNAVMSGFSTKLKTRLHGILSDVVIDTERMDGFVKYDNQGRPMFDHHGQVVGLSHREMIARMKENPALWEKIFDPSPTIEVFAILQFNFGGQRQSKPVKVIGIDPKSRSEVGGFSEYLVRQNGSTNPSFDLTPEALKQHDQNKRMRDGPEIISGAPPRPLIP